MPQAAGTLDTYQTRGRKEDFRDAIYTIAVDKMPFLSQIGKSDGVDAVLHRWQTDALRPPADNAQIEGDEYSYAVPAATVEPGNYLQIFRETLIVSGTAEAVGKYGRKSDLRRLATKKATELMRDMERHVVGRNVASNAGTSSAGRVMGSLPAWLTTNVSRGATGANGGYQTGTGLVNAATDGTARAFAEAQVKAIMQSAHTQGAMPTQIMMAPKHKVEFSAFPGISQSRVEQPITDARQKQAVIMAAADLYMSDFGILAAISNPMMSTALNGRQREAFIYDPEYFEMAYLRRMSVETPAKTGDAERRAMICEVTLVVKNEAAGGVIADLL